MKKRIFLLSLIASLFLQCTFGEEDPSFLDISVFLGHKSDKVIKQSFPIDSISKSVNYIEEGTIKVEVTNVNLDDLNHLTFNWSRNKGTPFVEKVIAYQFPVNISDPHLLSKKVGVLVSSFPVKGKSVKVYLGMPLEELEAILGEFEFAGFGWDCSGMVTTKLPQFKNIIISLGIPPASEDKMNAVWNTKAYTKLLGDGTFKSSNKNARQLGLQIITLSVSKD